MTTLTQKNVKYIVIHYTATPVESDFSAADIDRMHKKRGWKGIGYHKYIRKSGFIEKGRELREQGAHVRGHNHHSVGVCYEGGVYANSPNVGRDTRTPEQEAAMIRVIRELLDRYPGAQVIGHRDMPGAATQCPGFDAGAWWAEESKTAPTPAKKPGGTLAAILAALRAIFGGKA